MVIFNEGLNRIRDLVDTDITRGQLGTSSATPSETQTALVSPVAATIVTTTSTITDASGSSPYSLLTTNYTLPSTTGAGTTFFEYGNRSSSGNDVDYDRIVLNPNSGYAHTSTKELKIIKRYFFKNID